MKNGHQRLTIPLALTTFLIISMQNAAQSNIDSVELWIKEINSECARINNDTSKFKVVQKDIFDQSSEGGFLRSYYEDKILRKAILRLFGENGQSITEYYLSNGQVIFLHQTGISYKNPINTEKTEVKSEEQDKLYLKNQKIFRWYKNDKMIIGSALYLEKEKEIMADLKILF